MPKGIAQEDPLGCGIACVAYMIKQSYKETKCRYFKSCSANISGYLCRDLVNALAAAKRDYSYKHLNKRMMFRNGTIVFIKRSKRYPYGHYLVKTLHGWMDPWINLPALQPQSGFRKRLPGKPIYAVFPK